MVNKKTWEEFRNSGMLFWINQLLHTFGWAIVFDIDNNKIIDVYPARVKFRGFGEKQIEQGYKDISKFMAENADELYKESCE